MDASHDESRIVYMKVHVTLTQKEGKEERERMVMKGEKREEDMPEYQNDTKEREREERERDVGIRCVSVHHFAFSTMRA